MLLVGVVKIKAYVSLPQLHFRVQHYMIFYNSRRFFRYSNIGHLIKSISGLVIGKQWDIVTRVFLHQSFHKKLSNWEERRKISEKTNISDLRKCNIDFSRKGIML